MKAFILSKHGILNTMVNVYTKKGTAYIIYTFIFNKMSRLQYNVSIGCSTIWQKYGIIIGKLQMFIFVAMEMEKFYIPEISPIRESRKVTVDTILK